jgi:hypothetical protein
MHFHLPKTLPSHTIPIEVEMISIRISSFCNPASLFIACQYLSAYSSSNLFRGGVLPLSSEEVLGLQVALAQPPTSGKAKHGNFISEDAKKQGSKEFNGTFVNDNKENGTYSM